MEVARLGIMGEMTFTLKGADGNIKQIWNENRIGRFIRRNLGLDLKVPGLGSYKDNLVVKNLVTTAGKALAAGLLGASGAPAAAT